MSANSSTSSAKLNFARFGSYFFGLIPLVLLGFWKSYFSRFFEDSNSLTAYMHFHAILMTGWVTLLIVQPTLIRRKKLKMHRLLGKLSYFLMPLILISMLLLIHKRGHLRPIEEQTFTNVLIPLVGVFVVGLYYLLAVLNRKNTPIHARAMIGTGIALLDPTLMRLIGQYTYGYFFAIAIILGVFIILIFLERKHTRGRWVFSSLLAIYFMCYFLATFQGYTNNSLNLQPLDSLVRWFFKLPLT